MEQEITKLLVFIGIALLILSPVIIKYVIDAYKAKKELSNIEYANRVLDEVYISINASDINDEIKEICKEFIINKHTILTARHNFLNR